MLEIWIMYEGKTGGFSGSVTLLNNSIMLKQPHAPESISPETCTLQICT